jgi:hypothetical protein
LSLPVCTFAISTTRASCRPVSAAGALHDHRNDRVSYGRPRCDLDTFGWPLNLPNALNPYGILILLMAGAFECNEYQDVYLTPVDLEEGSLGTVLRPGESEVSGVRMVAWDVVEAALLRQDTVGSVSVAVAAIAAQCLIAQCCWISISMLCDVQAYTPHAVEYVTALGSILRELPPDLLASETFRCGAWARASTMPDAKR